MQAEKLPDGIRGPYRPMLGSGMPLPAQRLRFGSGIDKMMRTDCVCSGAQ